MYITKGRNNEKLSEYKISNTFIIGENDIDEYSVILKEYSGV